RICHGSWLGAPAIRLARALSISGTPSIGSTAPINRGRRDRGLVRLLPDGKPRRHRSLRQNAGGHQGGGPATADVVTSLREPTMRKFFGLNFLTGLLLGCAIAAAVAAAAVAYERYDTKTLKRTIRRDAVFCGANTGLPGFSSADDKGNWSGFDV